MVTTSILDTTHGMDAALPIIGGGGYSCAYNHSQDTSSGHTYS